MRHYQAYDHWKVLRMPWRTFLALSAEIEEHQRRQETAQFFKDRHLAAEWEENRDEWLRLQRPPQGG